MSQRNRARPARLPDDERAHFVEEMGLIWEELGSARMDGRIVGYLMFSNEPYVSSSQLSTALNASAGSISTATRRLVDVGFIKRVAVSGERSHYFRAEDDVWGAFLAGERRYLRRRAAFASEALTSLQAGDEAPKRRLANMRDYMTWLEQAHHKLLEDWEEYKRERNS
jgi:DNA-binding transcriptional regulator GbsR (MarR family)